MAQYMLQVGFSSEMTNSMIESPDMFDGSWFRSVVQRLDGRVVGIWACLGKYDAVMICELPDNTSVLALTNAFRATVPLTKVNVTCLLGLDEHEAALKKARGQ